MRIGNGAVRQLQLDIYGELMDSVYLYDKYGTPLSYDCGAVSATLDWLAAHWMKPDQGIWEVRGGRGSSPIRSSNAGWPSTAESGWPETLVPRRGDEWLVERNRIYEIMMRGWNEELRTFVQYWHRRPRCGPPHDAADVLRLADDPRMLGTIDRTQ